MRFALRLVVPCLALAACTERGARTDAPRRASNREEAVPDEPIPDEAITEAAFRSWARDAKGRFVWIDASHPGGFSFPRIDPRRVRLTTGEGQPLEVATTTTAGRLIATPADWTRVQDHLDAWVDGEERRALRVRPVVYDGPEPVADFWRRLRDTDDQFRPDRMGAVQGWFALEKHPAGALVQGEIARTLHNAAYAFYTDERFDEALPPLDRARLLVEAVDSDHGRDRNAFHRAQLAHLSGAYLMALRHYDVAIASAAARFEAHDAGMYRMRRAVTLAALGRYGEALDEIDDVEVRRAEPYARSMVPDEAWIRSGAMAVGLLDPDYASLVDAHAWARKGAYASKRFEVAANQTAREAALYLALGRIADARSLLDSLDALEDKIPGHARAFVELLRARVALLEGRTAVARQRLAPMAAPDRPATTDRCAAIQLLGEAAQAEDDLKTALVRYREAVACLAELDRRLVDVGDRAQWLHAHGGPEARMARALAQAGRASEAFRVLDGARAGVLEQRIDALAVDRDHEAWLAYQTVRRAEENARYKGCDHKPTKASRAKCKKHLAGLTKATRAAFAAFQAKVPPREATQRDAAWLARIQRALGAERGLLLVSGHGDDVLNLLVDARGVVSSTASDPLAPWAARLDALEHLFVVPDWHPKSFDPFLAAPERSTSFLPHADVLLRPTREHEGGPIVIADPDGSLPRSAEEGAWVADALDAKASAKAHRDAWLEALRTASILHYAGHAIGVRGDPWSVRLRLAGGEHLEILDFLGERELPRLVVLNGCATGPDARAGGGGLPAALVHRGVHYVVATSTETADGASTAFMKEFYRAKAHVDPAAAFRVAVAASRERRDDAWRTLRLWGH